MGRKFDQSKKYRLPAAIPAGYPSRVCISQGPNSVQTITNLSMISTIPSCSQSFCVTNAAAAFTLGIAFATAQPIPAVFIISRSFSSSPAATELPISQPKYSHTFFSAQPLFNQKRSIPPAIRTRMSHIGRDSSAIYRDCAISFRSRNISKLVAGCV